MELITKLVEQRADKAKALDKVLEAPTTESRDLNEAEAATFASLKAEVEQLGARIVELREVEASSAAAAEEARNLPTQEGGDKPVIRVKREEMTYRRGGDNSYFR